MAFNFPYTCPDIDDNIGQFKEYIKDNLNELVAELCPLFDGTSKDNLIKHYISNIYSDLEIKFEEVRQTNSELRDEAEAQIDVLIEEISELKNKIDELNLE